MSDIQEEQKRLYKRAEENDIKLLKEEIKEILEFDFESQGERIEINEYERNILKDYITNLQEENKKLKELCDKYEEEHKTTFEEWKKDIKANKKAIEYIEQFDFDYLDATYNHSTREILEDLLNILKGDNK